ncbi:tyrosine-protein phosphatase [uncultured Fibrobacter sp.]|uniref:tyrosine-protein phosphatase n=1 Tax=uncultured Fibrobacter sp. TaxID=261512 RepID=UPI0025D1F510|nr:tyrosine-protein phosphatase [uncultured Fibrobacter sp.]
MFQLKKTLSIFAIFILCAQVFLACSDSDTSSVNKIVEPQPTSSEVVEQQPTSSEQFSSSETEAQAASSETAEPTSSSKTERPHIFTIDSAGIHTIIMGDSAGQLTSSDLYLDCPADSFLNEFQMGDIVTVAINGYDTLEMPVVESAYDVPIAGFALVAIKDYDYLILSVHYGHMSNILKITDVVIPIEVSISMKEKGGFLFGLEMRNVQNMDYYAEIYPDLSIEEFANFREVRTTGMGENRLYRSSNPVDPGLGRNLYADSLAKVAGVSTFINLSDSEEFAKSCSSFDSSYYATQNIIFLSLPVYFYSWQFEEGIVTGFRYMIEHDGPYLVHCTFGMDRTGFTIAVLEGLMGATTEDLQADYSKTFSNFFNVVDRMHVALNEQQVGFFRDVVIRNMRTVYHAKGIDVPVTEPIDWAAATEKYLEKIGMTQEEIAALKERLK